MTHQLWRGDHDPQRRDWGERRYAGTDGLRERDRLFQQRWVGDQLARTMGRSFNDGWENAFGSRTPREVYGGDRTFRGRGPKGYRRADERIRDDVCERLTMDDYVDATHIEITVKGGEVTLTGTVTSRDEKRRAEDLIDDVAGVIDVYNNLRLKMTGGELAHEHASTPRQDIRH